MACVLCLIAIQHIFNLFLKYTAGLVLNQVSSGAHGYYLQLLVISGRLKRCIEMFLNIQLEFIFLQL